MAHARETEKIFSRPGLILLGEYGSVAQGTANENSDHDYMGIVIETPTQVIGLEEFKTARVSDAVEGEKSQAGEDDVTYHSLRKFVKLAAAGNPTVGSILHLPKYEVLTEIGDSLLENADLFRSRKAGRAYLGYVNSQIEALQGGRGAKRPELVEEHGYDTKFAYHAFRLAHQGIDYMVAGDPGIPLASGVREQAIGIRSGLWALEDVLEQLHALRSVLENTLNNFRLDIPDEPDYARINKLLVSMHETYWGYYY